MAVELASAYVSIIPETSRVAPGIKKALGTADKAGDAAGRSLGGKFTTGMKSVLKKSAIGVGVTAGTAVAAGVTKGIGRLTGIEQAEAKLRGLGHSASGVSSIMDNALASVKGTSYGLEEAATTAAAAVAAGIQPGAELEQVLTTVADTAAIAGTSMGEMGTIFGSVAARGKLQGDDLLQLTSRGVPVLQMLSKQLGVTAADVSDMVSKGQIDFKTFEAALRDGVGGSAQEAGKTVRGALANMGAAAGRLGATLAGPFFRQAAAGFGGVTGLLDSMNDAVGPTMRRFEEWLTSSAVPALKDMAASAKAAFAAFAASGSVDRAGAAFGALGRTISELGPALAGIAGALADAAAAIGVSGWELFVTTLDAANAVLTALTPLIRMVSDLMRDHPGLVTAAVGAWTAFKTVPGFITPIREAVDKVRSRVTDMSGGVKKAMASFQASTAAGSTAVGGFGAAATTVAKGGLKTLGRGVGAVTAAFGGPWGLAITGAVGALTSMYAESKRMNESLKLLERQSRAGAQAFTAIMDAAVNGTSQIDAATTAVDTMTGELDELAANGPGTWNRLTLAIAEHNITMMASESAHTSQARKLRDSSDAAKEAGEVIDRLGLTNEQLAAAAAGSTGAFQEMHHRLMENGRGGELLARKLTELRSRITAARQAAAEMGPAGVHAAEALKQIAEGAGTAEDRAAGLRIALMELNGIELSAAEAGAELTRQLDQAAGQFDQVAGASLTAAGGIDTSTTAGVAAHDMLMNVGNAMQRSVAAGNDVNAVYGQFEQQLSGLQSALGLTDAQYQQLLASYGLTPEQLVTTATLQADPAKATLTVLQAEIGRLKDGDHTVHMNVQDAGARRKLEEMGFKIKVLDETTGYATVDVSDGRARAKLDDLLTQQLPKVDNARATASAFLDASQLLATNDLAGAQLATLNLKRPTPLASMDISRLKGAQITALQDVGLLDGQKPTPDADLNIEDLTAEQQIALAKVFDLDAQKPTPWASLSAEELHARAQHAEDKLAELDRTHTEPNVTANTAQALDKLGGVRSLLASLKDKFINVFVTKHERGGHGFGGHFADGGQLPAHARGDRHDGYRLPNTGPGTHITDGFLALDAYNMPVARLDHGEWIINRRSSAKYDKELAAINAGTFPKLPGYAEGGVFDDILTGQDLRTPADFLAFARGQNVDGAQASRPLEGAPYVFGGSNWGDCSGTASAFAAFAIRMPPFPRKFTTMSEESWLRDAGFTMGAGAPGTLRIGWYNGGPGGGHTSVTLPDGTNAEMGGARGNGQLGGPAAGADHSMYTHRAWFPAASSSPATSTSAPTGTADTMADSADPVADTSDAGEDHTAYPTSYSQGTTTGGDDNLVPLSDEASSAADTLHREDPGLLGGASTWSDFSGSVVAAAVSGQVRDILGVFGIPDELPPIVKAGQQWYQQRREADERAAAAVEQALITAAGPPGTQDGSAVPGAHPDAEPATAPDPAGTTAALTTPPATTAPAAPDPADGRDDTTGDDPGDVHAAVRRAMAGHGWDSGAQWDAVDYIVSHESQWNPTAVNPSSGAFGLFQLNPASGTLQQYLPDRSTDPEDQGNAGAAYIRDRYGDPVSARAFWEANHWYDRGGRARGVGHMLKNTLKPERVLSPEQTAAFETLVYDTLPGMRPDHDHRDATPRQDDEAATSAAAAGAPGDQPPVPAERGEVFDEGSVSKLVNEAVPTLLAQNSLADIAGRMTSMAVRTAGYAATDIASQAVSTTAAGAGEALGMPGASLASLAGTVPLPGVNPAAALTMVPSLAGVATTPISGLAAGGVGQVGQAATDLAAWYAGEVAHGVVGAGEQYVKELVGASFGGLMGDVRSVLPPVRQAADAVGLQVPMLTSPDTPPPAAHVAAGAGGDVYNIQVTDNAQAFAYVRRKLAKDSHGLVGAR